MQKRPVRESPLQDGGSGGDMAMVYMSLRIGWRVPGESSALHEPGGSRLS
jgi:hypothetical protein